MILAFRLSMPGVNSWNGKWSGEGRNYVVTRPVLKRHQAEIANHVGKSFTYNFGDGWCASVEVTEVDSKDAAQLKRVSHGFCGYDWMVDSILSHGRIVDTKERAELEAQP